MMYAFEAGRSSSWMESAKVGMRGSLAPPPERVRGAQRADEAPSRFVLVDEDRGVAIAASIRV